MEDINISCQQPTYHTGRWLILIPFGKAKVPMCLACSMLILEDPIDLVEHKKFILGGILDILQSAPEVITRVITADDKISFGLIHVILDLTLKPDENLSSTAAECALLLFRHFESKSLKLAIVNGLITQTQLELNSQQSARRFQMLGRLLQNSPELSMEVLQQKGDYLRHMVDSIVDPCDEVKYTAMVGLIRMYQSLSVASYGTLALHSEMLSNVLAVLKNSHEREVLKCALALLTILLRKDEKTLDLIMQSRTFVSSMKKILLSNEPVLQTSAVQCICYVIQGHPMDEPCISLLLDASIPEFLFEILSTTNELLIESILTCVTLFSQHSTFFMKHHEIHGVETVIRLADQVLSAKNWKLSARSIQLLAIIFSRSNNSVGVLPNDRIFKQAAQLQQKALQYGNEAVVIASSNLLSKFLRKENLPHPMPFSSVTNLANICLTSICRYLLTSDGKVDRTCLEQLEKECTTSQNGSRGGHVPKEFELLQVGLQVVHACTRLAANYASDPCARESTFSCPATQTTEAAEQSSESQTSATMNNLTECILAALDVIFLPYTLFLGTSNDLGRHVCAYVLRILSEIYELFGWGECDVLQELTCRLIKSGFIRLFWNSEMLTYSSLPRGGEETMKSTCCSVLKWLLWSLLKQEKIKEEYLNIIKTGVEQFDDSFESSASVLLQKCNFFLEGQQDLKCAAAQLTYIFVCYASFLNGDQIVPVDDLLPNLICFITLNAEKKNIPRIVLKHLVFLFAVCTYEAIKRNVVINTMIASMQEAESIMKRTVQDLPSPEAVYTHNLLLLWWCFRNEEHTALSLYTLCEWLKCCIPSTETYEAEPEVLHTLTMFFSRNKFVQASFLTCLESTSKNFSKRAFIFLQLMGKCEDNQEIDFRKNLQEFFTRIIQHINVHLVNILMTLSGNDESELHDSLPVLLDILVWCQKQLPDSVIQSDAEAKLAFHVTKLCTSKSLPDNLLISCLRYLWFILWDKKDSQSHKVWSFLVENRSFCAVIQNCLKFKGNNIHLESLRLIVAMMWYQRNYGLEVDAGRLKIPSKELFPWLNSRCSDLQRLTLKALLFLTKMGFQNSVLEIVRSDLPSFPDVEESVTELSGNDFRILFTSLLNLITKNKPVIDEDAVPCLIDLLEFLHRKHPDIENHLMLQPWIRLALGNRVFDTANIDGHTWNLFDKWLTYPRVNCALIPAVQHLAKEVSVRNTSSAEYSAAALKLCYSPYHEYLPESTKQLLTKSDCQDTHS